MCTVRHYLPGHLYFVFVRGVTLDIESSGVNPAGTGGHAPQKICRMGDGNASCPPNMAEISLHSD